MKLFQILLLLIIVGCDAIQQKSGIVLDSKTHLPIEGVAISEYEEEDSTNSFTRRIYSDKDGKFEFSSTGFTNSFNLFFIKDGYKTIEIKNTDSDTIVLVPIK